MLKTRLKELDIKITELANYLQISRPTMYKFIEDYDSGNADSLNSRINKLFDYIENNRLIDKRNVINFILNNLSKVRELETGDELESIKTARNFFIKHCSEPKTEFILKCMQGDEYDLFIKYVLEIEPLLNKKRLSSNDKIKVKPYLDIVNIYSNDITKENK